LAKDLIFVDAEVGLEWSLLGGFLYDFCDFWLLSYDILQDETPVVNFIELFGRKAAMVRLLDACCLSDD
jgi:hypothetical protein